MSKWSRLTSLFRIPLLLVAMMMQAGATTNVYVPPTSDPENLLIVGDYIYFSADDGIHGRELWRVDVNGKAKMVLDITPGPEGAKLDHFCTFNGQIYFCVTDGANHGDLWRSDGTPAGTVRVRQFGEDTGEMGISVIVSHSYPRLFFGVGESNGTSIMWSSDGTAAGTAPLVPASGSGELMFEHYVGTVVNGIHFFSARHGSQEGLWRSDGTREGTVLLRGFVGAPSAIFPLDDQQFIVAGDDGSGVGQELWISGGTPETTRFLEDIYPGPESSEIRECSTFKSPSGSPRVIFAATTPDFGREYWETDGTPEGTRLREDIFPGAGSSSPSSMVDAGHSMFFVAIGDGIGKELWRYNVARDKFELFMDMYAGVAGSEPYALCVAGGTLYFSALHPDHGEEFWVVKSVDSPPQLFAEFMPGPASSFPYYTVNLRSRVVTVATSPVHGRELWIADGSREEMILLADINTDSSVNPSSFPDKLTPAGDYLFFTANDIEHGNEIWRTDGSADGTVLVKDVFRGSPSSNPEYLTTLGNWLYFSADDGMHGAELWRSDGTEAGTSMVSDISPVEGAKPRNLTALKDRLLFSASEPRQGEELWCLEIGGQPRILKDICPGPKPSSPEKFFVWKGYAYFQADDGVRGRELWRTDGTSDGTVIILDVVDAPFKPVSIQAPREYNGSLYFAADTGGSGTELCMLDESQTKLSLVRDIVSPDTYDVLQGSTGKPAR